MKTLENGSVLSCFVAYGGPLPGQSLILTRETGHGHNQLYVPVLVPLDPEALERNHVSPTSMLCPVGAVPDDVISDALTAIQTMSDEEARALVFEGVCSCEACRKRAM